MAGRVGARARSHMPWGCILAKKVQEFKAKNDGNIPTGRQQLRAFQKEILADSKAFVEAWNEAKNPPTPIPYPEANFKEAHDNVRKQVKAYVQVRPRACSASAHGAWS